MSMIRHQPFFHGRTSRTNRLKPRNFSSFEKILLLADEKTARRISRAFEENFLEIHATQNGVDAMEKIMCNDFEALIHDTGLRRFPLEMFYSAVERIRPALLRRFIFLIDDRTAQHTLEFIERVDGLKVWRPIDPEELLRMIEMVRGNAAMEASPVS